MRRRLLTGAGALAALALVAGAMLPAAAAPAAAEEAPSAPGSPTLADQLVDAAAAGAQGADALAAAVGLPAEGPSSLQVDEQGAIAATVLFVSAPSTAQRAQVAALARIDREHRFTSAFAVTVSPAHLTALAAIDGVVTVTPVQRPVGGRGAAPDAAARPAQTADAASCRPWPEDSDQPLATALARSRFGVDGAGVKIGILSDSYDTSARAATRAADDVAAGLLPGPGNPCGYTTPVTVLDDSPSGGDEGRGMAQIVHGIAPAAELLFAQVNSGEYAMADNIVALAVAGARVIVDDMGYLAEPYFQQGVISSAIAYVRSAYGVAYYSAAGNSTVLGAPGGPSAGRPISAWSTPAYRPMPCPVWVDPPAGATAIDCLDFDPTSAEAPYDVLTLAASSDHEQGESLTIPLLSFGESIFDPAFSAFEVRLYSWDAPAPVRVGDSYRSDATVPNVSVSYPRGTAMPAGDYALLVVRDISHGVPTTDPAIWLGFFDGEGNIRSRRFDRSAGVDVVGRTSYGHPADGSAIGVAAAPWIRPHTLESSSSFGPGTMLFEPPNFDEKTPGRALPAPLTVAAPRITGVDGQRTSFFGRPIVGPSQTVYRFFGTSAAAPSIAAVHALAQSYVGEGKSDLITETMLRTASGMTNPAPDDVPDAAAFGAGLANADALLSALAAPAPAQVTASASADTVAASWTAVAPSLSYRAQLLRGEDVVASRDTAETSATFSGVLPETSYRVRVTSINPDSVPGGRADSAVVTTLRPAQPAVTPTAPPASGLVPATHGSVLVSPGAVQAGETVTVSGLPSGGWVYGWLFSDPHALGWAWTGSGGTASLTVLKDVPAGGHRLAISAADGSLIGWAEVQVTAAPAPARAALAASGSEPSRGAAVIGALALLVGVGAVLAVRRRRRVS